jgi:hypothetical protein
VACGCLVVVSLRIHHRPEGERYKGDDDYHGDVILHFPVSRLVRYRYSALCVFRFSGCILAASYHIA